MQERKKIKTTGFGQHLKLLGLLSFNGTNEDINSFRTRALFALDYDSPFRIGMDVFYSIPSPASHKEWGGVNGLKNLFKSVVFKKITEIEKIRIEPLIQKYVGNDVQGAVITFQKGAYNGVMDSDVEEKSLLKDGVWHITESMCSCSNIRLFDVTITRYMGSPRYAKLLHLLRDYIQGDN